MQQPATLPRPFYSASNKQRTGHIHTLMAKYWIHYIHL